MATAWLQMHDFSSKELGNMSRAEMLVAFDSVDWRAERSKNSEDDPNTNCPPGFGINLGGNILHLCPYDDHNMFFHLHYEADARFIGIVPIKRKRSHYVESYPVGDAPKVITYFMLNDLRRILEIR
ncbi:hypothetical protein K3729_15440 [Rhodobacteraceae bacterium S2214]|nr:hypothetical protein K3729_15440 [Rhodobacteraceae bacterium S2214]